MEPSSDISDLLQFFKFSQFKQVSLIEEIVIYSCLALFIGLAIYYLNQLLAKEKQKKKERLKHNYQRKQQLVFETLIRSLKLLPQEYQLLEKLSGASHFGKNYRLIESAQQFESQVEQFKQASDSTTLFPAIYTLRHKLGFGYNNPQTPFICTQMLTKGAKLECFLKVGTQEIAFISPIVHITEDYLYILPPTDQKQPVRLNSIEQLTCQVKREDGCYEFQLPLFKQVFGKKNYIILKHTSVVKKVIEREFERIPVRLPSALYQLTEEQIHLSKKTLQQFKNDETLPRLAGEIIDIGLGGFYFIATFTQPLLTLKEQEFVMLEVPDVDLLYDLQAQILKTTEAQGRFCLHLKFFHLNDLERLKLHKFLIRIKNHPHNLSYN